MNEAHLYRNKPETICVPVIFDHPFTHSMFILIFRLYVEQVRRLSSDLDTYTLRERLWQSPLSFNL